MKVTVTLQYPDADTALIPIEVLVINGGAEHTHAILTVPGEQTVVDIAVPQAVVLREHYTPQ